MYGKKAINYLWLEESKKKQLSVVNEAKSKITPFQISKSQIKTKCTKHFIRQTNLELFNTRNLLMQTFSDTQTICVRGTRARTACCIFYNNLG